MTLLADSPEGMRIAINRPGLGFFAHLTWYIPILIVSAERNIPVEIASVSPQYVSPEWGADFVSYFFTDQLATRSNVPPNLPWTQIETISQVVADNDRMPIGFDNAHQAFFNRFAFRPWVLEALDALLASRPANRLIGVHYRGTDKKSEAPRVDYPDMLAVIDRELEKSPDAHLFIATDEAPFLHTCYKRYGTRILFNKDYVRSVSDKAPHLQPGLDKFRLGRDAVVNCALLSRCDVLIKTPSFLSGWAKIINPALETYLVARPYDRATWFPDRDIPSYPISPEGTARPHG